MHSLLIITISMSGFILMIGLSMILTVKRKRAVRKSLEKSVRQLVAENKLLISEVEYFKNKTIGIDATSRKMIFVNYRQKGNNQKCIDLENILFCRIDKRIDETSNKIKQVCLKIKLKGKYGILRFVFYDSQLDKMKSELLLIRKAYQWRKKILQHMGTISFYNTLQYLL